MRALGATAELKAKAVIPRPASARSSPSFTYLNIHSRNTVSTFQFTKTLHRLFVCYSVLSAVDPDFEVSELGDAYQVDVKYRELTRSSQPVPALRLPYNRGSKTPIFTRTYYMDGPLLKVFSYRVTRTVVSESVT